MTCQFKQLTFNTIFLTFVTDSRKNETLFQDYPSASLPSNLLLRKEAMMIQTTSRSVDLPKEADEQIVVVRPTEIQNNDCKYPVSNTFVKMFYKYYNITMSTSYRINIVIDELVAKYCCKIQYVNNIYF